MKKNRFSCSRMQAVLKLGVCALAVQASGLLAASPPPLFTYQGQLVEIVNGANTAVKSGTNDIFAVDMWLRLYNSVGADKASALYGRKVSVLVNKGYFSVDIGDTCGIPLTAAYTNLLNLISASDSGTLLVGITPFDDANDEISPRQPLFAAPYALLANDVTQALGDFTATNGTALFQALEVSGAAVFKGAVTNQGAVAINGNATFANGLTNSGTTAAKQFVTGATLTQSGGDTTVNGSLNVGGSATVQAGGITVNGTATLQGDLSASNVTVSNGMSSGALVLNSAAPTVTPSLTCTAPLTVSGQTLFKTYFVNSAWLSRSDGTSDSGSFTASADGLYVLSVIIRRDNRGYGSLTFTFGGKSIVPYTNANTDQYSVNSVTLTVLMKSGETISWGSEVSQNCTGVSQIEYSSFDSLPQ